MSKRLLLNAMWHLVIRDARGCGDLRRLSPRMGFDSPWTCSVRNRGFESRRATLFACQRFGIAPREQTLSIACGGTPVRQRRGERSGVVPCSPPVPHPCPRQDTAKKSCLPKSSPSSVFTAFLLNSSADGGRAAVAQPQFTFEEVT